jgi:Dihydroorotate dehydrogenase
MIRFSDNFETEYFVPSGIVGQDGSGWLHHKILEKIGLWDSSLLVPVAKTVTLQPIKGNWNGNPWHCIRPSSFYRLRPAGTVNFIGLTNPGFDEWKKEIGSRINTGKIHPVVSILGTPDELARMAKDLNDFDIPALEINASCPNTNDCSVINNATRVIESCQVVREISDFPIILKVSVAHDIDRIIPKVENYCKALAINSVPYPMVFPNKQSPLSHLGSGGGGISGLDAQQYTWALVKKLKEMTNVPVIAPSIWIYEDIAWLRNVYKADAFSFGALALLSPWLVTKYIRLDLRRKQ